MNLTGVQTVHGHRGAWARSVGAEEQEESLMEFADEHGRKRRLSSLLDRPKPLATQEEELVGEGWRPAPKVPLRQSSPPPAAGDDAAAAADGEQVGGLFISTAFALSCRSVHAPPCGDA